MLTRTISTFLVMWLLTNFFGLLISANTVNAAFLAKPTGQYGVGFRDFHFQDNSRCPGPFYNEKGVTSADYSNENTQHCREIMARVYYPANVPSGTLGAGYYPPLINQTISQFDWIINDVHSPVKLSEDSINQLKALTTYSHENASVINNTRQLPVILFSPADGEPVQAYENVITNLVSNGYVVVGVNSLFVTGFVSLPNGHVITTNLTGLPNNVKTPVRVNDLMYVYRNLRTINGSLSNIMDLQNVAIMGHSGGANAVAAILSSANKTVFKAAISMAAHVQKLYPSSELPFMHIIAASLYWVFKYGPEKISYIPRYNLAENNYFVGIAPNVPDLISQPEQNPYLYSVHSNASDWATLQYTSSFQAMLPVFDVLNKSPHVFNGLNFGPEYGHANGYDTLQSYNTYILQFFDTYLKGKSNPVFNNKGTQCGILSPNTIIDCGPSVFPEQ